MPLTWFQQAEQQRKKSEDSEDKICALMGRRWQRKSLKTGEKKDHLNDVRRKEYKTDSKML